MMLSPNSLSYLKLEASLREPKPELYREIALLYKDHPAPVIAEAIGVSLSTVRRAIRKHKFYKGGSRYGKVV